MVTQRAIQRRVSNSQKIFSLRFLRPDIAIVRSIWETPTLTIDGRTIPHEDMIVTYMMSKEESTWVIVSVDLHNVASELGQSTQLPFTQT